MLNPPSKYITGPTGRISVCGICPTVTQDCRMRPFYCHLVTAASNRWFPADKSIFAGIGEGQARLPGHCAKNLGTDALKKPNVILCHLSAFPKTAQAAGWTFGTQLGPRGPLPPYLALSTETEQVFESEWEQGGRGRWDGNPPLWQHHITFPRW